MATKQYDNYADLITFTRASTGTALRHVGYGAELVTNGTFDTDSDWTKGTGWTISGGNLVGTSVSAFTFASQPIVLDPTKVYQITFEVSSVSSGTVRCGFTGGTTLLATNNLASASTVTVNVIPNSGNNAVFIGAAGAGFTGTIGSVSVKEVIFDRATDPLVLFNHPTNTPRIEYDASGNRKGLLIEEARTNLALYSEEFDNAYWVKSAGGTGVVPVVTADHDTGPFGGTTADRVQFDSGAAGNSQISSTNIVTSIGTTYTFSIWMRSLAGDVLVTMFNNSTIQNVTVTSSWQRFTFTATASLTGDTVRLAKRDVWGTIGTADFLLWGAQLEAGSFPTSYISTAGSTATRAADVASIPTSAFGYNQKAGTVVVDFETQFGTTVGFPRIWEIGNTSTNINRVQVYVSSAAGNVLGAVFSNNVLSCNINTGAQTSPASGRFAFAFADDDFAALIDGGSPVTDTSGSFTTPSTPRNTLKIGGAGDSSSANMSGHIKSIQYFPRRLTDSQLQRLTT